MLIKFKKTLRKFYANFKTKLTKFRLFFSKILEIINKFKIF